MRITDEVRKQYNAANAAKFSAQDGLAVPHLSWSDVGDLLAEYDDVAAALRFLSYQVVGWQLDAEKGPVRPWIMGGYQIGQAVPDEYIAALRKVQP